MPRFYQENIQLDQTEITLSSEVSHHVGKVLRMQAGETLTIFDGQNHELDASILEVKKKEVMVHIHGVKTISRESPCHIQLAQVMSKGDRMELVVQKMTELGVSTFVPLTSERCVVRLDAKRMEKKLSQWQAIIASACEQCGRNQLPLVHPVSSFDDYLQNGLSGTGFILHPESHHHIKDFSPNIDEPIKLLIGPEGGFSEQEISRALDAGYKLLNIGPRMLRTETAAITAVGLIQAYFGDI